MNSLINEIDDLNKNNVNIRFIGSKKELSKIYTKKVQKTCESSWGNDGLHLNVAMNYGGRRELTEAVMEISEKVVNKEISISEINDKKMRKNCSRIIYENRPIRIL